MRSQISSRIQLRWPTGPLDSADMTEEELAELDAKAKKAKEEHAEARKAHKELKAKGKLKRAAKKAALLSRTLKHTPSDVHENKAKAN